MSFELDIFLSEKEFRRKARLCGLPWKNGPRPQQKSCQEELLESCMWKDQRLRVVALCPAPRAAAASSWPLGVRGCPCVGLLGNPVSWAGRHSPRPSAGDFAQPSGGRAWAQ